jgi:hypothetical protein
MPPEMPASMKRMPRSARSAWRRFESCQFELPPSTIVSPAASSAANSSIVASVASPAGTMSQTMRGAVSIATACSEVSAPSRPSPMISWVFSTERL